jgi:hypothetical protein
MLRAIVDAGPLVAFIDRAEQHHRWVVEQVEQLQPPLLEIARFGSKPPTARRIVLAAAQSRIDIKTSISICFDDANDTNA